LEGESGVAGSWSIEITSGSAANTGVDEKYFGGGVGGVHICVGEGGLPKLLYRVGGVYTGGG